MGDTPPKEKAHIVLKSRQRAYTKVLRGTGVDGNIVLEDLAKFCRAHESTFHTNPRVALILQGRHEVWVRIQQHLQLSDEQMWKLYGNPTLTDLQGSL
jgi:hypothetical protein